MKSIFNYIFPVLVFLAGSRISAQVIDLRTGIDNISGLPIPVNTADDTWQVSFGYISPPSSLPTLYFPVNVGTGTLLSINGSTFTQFSYSPRDFSVGWLSPYLYQTAGPYYGDHLKPVGSGGAPSSGYYYYKMTFDRPTAACAVASAALRFKHIGIDDHISQIFVNGTSITIPVISILSNNNINIPVTPGLISTGSNTIVLEVKNDGDWTGMEINGDLFIESCGFVDFTLTDKDGNEKDEYCLEEDVYMNGTIAGATNYLVDLYDVSGGTPVWISQQGTTGFLPGTPSYINLTDLFENSASWPVTFQTNAYKIYKVNLAINSPCGLIVLAKNFHFICCDRSADASFSLLAGTNPKLKGKSMTAGDHSWAIYGMSPYTGEFTSREAIATFDKPLFATNNGETTCYFVKHSVANDCGASCSSQKFCSFKCEDKVCNLEAPVAQYDPVTKMLTWTNVTGAYGYVIQYIKNGCCGSGASSSNDVGSIDVTDNTPYFLNLLGVSEGTGELGQCYSVRVFAKCPDGSLSMGSWPPICIQ